MLDSLTDWEPVKLIKQQRNVVELLSFCHHPSGYFLYVLELLQQSIADTMQQAVTVVKMTADKGMSTSVLAVSDVNDDVTSRS